MRKASQLIAKMESIITNHKFESNDNVVVVTIDKSKIKRVKDMGDAVKMAGDLVRKVAPNTLKIKEIDAKYDGDKSALVITVDYYGVLNHQEFREEVEKIFE